MDVEEASGPAISTKKKLDKSDLNSENLTVTVEKTDTAKKGESEDPKPRIVLTFRSEKPGAKSSNMKIVSNEEKHEEVSPRRSNRSRAKWDSDDDNEALISPQKDKHASENDEASDGSHNALKRSMRHRSKEFSDNVLANAIARKEKSYNDTVGTPQRLSRRIKPTAKILANKELRIGLESQNNVRLGITTEPSPDEGVQTRRSARNKSTEPQVDKKQGKRSHDEEESSDKKVKHLCGLGLKAINPDDMDEDGDNRDLETDDIDIEEDEGEDEEEVDDDSEVISKLIEADEESATDESSDEFLCSAEASQGKRPRRSTRLCSTMSVNESDHSSIGLGDGELKTRPRRSSRKTRTADLSADEYERPPAGGDEGNEATCPEDESKVIATCHCEANTNIYAAPDELTEPVFCQAIELVDDIRVGCSHRARKEDDDTYSALVRAGPRAPYVLLCGLHAAQMKKHMCCPTCGLFCTQGIFYQCSLGHLFHLECGLACAEGKGRWGCPHCGVRSYRWQPQNSGCGKVRLCMAATNKRVLLPDQRVQCTPAYLGFSTLDPSLVPQEPIIPADLLPSLPKDLELKDAVVDEEGSSPEQRLYDAIVTGESSEKLIDKIVRNMDLNKAIDKTEATCMHAAASSGNVTAVHLLRCASARLDLEDSKARTPLMSAVLALVDKTKKEPEIVKEIKEEMEVDNSREENENEKEAKPVACESEKQDVNTEGPKDEDLMRVVRYLVAAGCNVNQPGPEGMTALHMAAQHGSQAVCSVLLESSSCEVDPRDQGGWTPLVWAAENEHPSVVRLLLSYGADARACDADGNGATHWCSLAGAPRSLQLLLDAAPSTVNDINSNADTPLHIAARQGNYSCVVILLARGAKTDVENSSGELPVDVCGGHPQCQTIISFNMHVATLATANRCRVLVSDISNGRELHPIPCVNEVDAAPAPDFTYVTRHVLPAPLHIDNTLDTMQGCECKDACDSASCACGTLSVRRWFSRGRLLHNFPYHDPPMLFECNQTCACNQKKCNNRVVTSLSKQGATFIRTEVFRTATRGWGLRATTAAPQGAPVALYTGELLPTEEADTRAADQYMFALDIKPDLLEQCDDKTQLCVDAATYGSAARFINHSCRPNLAPVRLYTGARDLRLPAVVLFAIQPIQTNDELTFDYGDKFWSVKSKWMRCECEMPECRYPVKSTDKSET